MRLLIHPPLRIGEGLRGYVCRLATDNSIPSLFRPMLDSISAVTGAAPELAELTGQGIESLRRRGSSVIGTGRQPCGIRIGDVVLPRKVMKVTGRRICPRCIANTGTSDLAWELRRFNVCSRHGLRLVEACSACKRPLSWAHPSSDQCACGYPLGHIKAKTGPSGRKLLCRVLAASMLRTIHDGPVAGHPDTATALRIDWTLVLCDFIDGVVLPVFAERHGLAGSKRFQAARDTLMARMLEDRRYRDYLRDTVFMFASADPMTLVSALRPGRLDEWHFTRGSWCWSQLCFHQSLWDFERTMREDAARRAMSRKMKQRSLHREGVMRSSAVRSRVLLPAGQLGAREQSVAESDRA